MQGLYKMITCRISDSGFDEVLPKFIELKLSFNLRRQLAVANKRAKYEQNA
jgi:hypothetical protein